MWYRVSVNVSVNNFFPQYNIIQLVYIHKNQILVFLILQFLFLLSIKYDLNNKWIRCYCNIIVDENERIEKTPYNWI